MQPYDLIVIGSGPGGQRAAIQGAKAGKRVAMVEKQAAVGGVCVNTGTIPSKTMREAVLHLSGFYSKTFYGSNYNVKENVTMADLNFRVSSRHRERSGGHAGPAPAKWSGRPSRLRKFHRCTPPSRTKRRWLRGTGRAIFRDRHRHEAGAEPESAYQRANHHRQRPNSDACRRFRGR